MGIQENDMYSLFCVCDTCGSNVGVQDEGLEKKSAKAEKMGNLGWHSRPKNTWMCPQCVKRTEKPFKE